MTIEEYLTGLAGKKSWQDLIEEDPDSESYIDDYAGGNIDDAFYGGIRQGEIDLARELLEKFFKKA